MHPCVKQVCVNFFYGSGGGEDVLARRFPDDFNHAVPEHAVAVAATCVSAILYSLSIF
jgi:Domain of unknown function (DUF6532)